MRGVNAAVVGLLGATLYNPLWTTSVESPGDVALVLTGYILLVAWRAPPLLVVILGAAAGIWIQPIAATDVSCQISCAHFVYTLHGKATYRRSFSEV